MKNVLIIGGTGFIGRNVIENFIYHNLNVSVYGITKIESLKNSFVGDIFTDVDYEKRFKNIDAVIYLVTTVSPKKSMENPEDAYTKDIPLLLKTLECCKNNGIKRLIFASSGGTVYGDIGEKNATENDDNYPLNNYGICKVTCEKILEMYNRLYGMENISLRIANPYGNFQNSGSGVGVITTFAELISNNEKITIFGDGMVTRDFIYVGDVAEAFYLALNYKFDCDIRPIFNIGSGIGLSINDIINIVETTLNKKAKIEYLPSRTFDVQYNVLDIEKAKKYLKYNPGINETEKIKEYIKRKYLIK